MGRLQTIVFYATSGVLAACGGGGGPGVLPDAMVGDGPLIEQDGAPVVLGRQLLSVSSDERGFVRVGTPVSGAEIVLLDAVSQRPLGGARVDAVEQDDGFFLRISRDDGAYEPEVLQVSRGGRAVVAVNSSTPDVRGRVVRLGVSVFDQDFLGLGNINQVMALSATEQRPSVVFAPEIAADSVLSAEQFRIYRSALPGTLLAVKSEQSVPANGTVVRARSRTVSTQGLSRAGVPVQGPQVQGAVVARRGATVVAPTVSALQVTQPDASGNATLIWAADDAGGGLLGFDVAVDTTQPNRRLDKSARAWTLRVLKGEHFACVRPVFDGSDVEPRIDCVNFDANLAPAAPNLRVTVRSPASPATGVVARARQPVAFEVEVDNTGDIDVAAFDVAVVVSRDGRPENGEGETRLLRFDGVAAKGVSRRVATVLPERDGRVFVAAQVDPQGLVLESNPHDNTGRLPLQVEPAGNNRAPILSLAAPVAQGAIAKGRGVPLVATAIDPEEGDLTNRIVWTSTLNGFLGQGGSLEPTNLLPGRHRIRATVKDQGVVMAPAPYDNSKLAMDGHGFGVLWPLARAPQFAADMEAPEEVVAEFVVEIADPELPVNSAPVIAAGPAVTTSVGVAVSPLASAYDPDGDNLSIEWQAFFGATSVPMQEAGSLNPVLVPQAPGVYRLVLQVSDGKAIAKDETFVKVLANNAAPVVTLSLPSSGAVGAAVTAVVVATDPDNDPLAVSFELVRPEGSKALVQAGNGLMPSFNPDIAGTYEFVALADDGRGGRAKAVALFQAGARVEQDAGSVIRSDAGIVVPDAAVPPQDTAVATDAPVVVVVDAGTGTVVDAPKVFLPQGLPCAQSWECGTGYCADGVCCESACVGLCHSCNQAASMGMCVAAAPGQDPRGECVKGSMCTATNECGPFVVRPGSVLVASGQVELMGRGTWQTFETSHRRPATCDAASHLCLLAVSDPKMSTMTDLWAVKIDNPQAPPQIVAKGIWPFEDNLGFEYGVVKGTQGGAAFAWKPGWSAPRILADSAPGGCIISPIQTHAACLRSLRPDGQGGGFLVDVALGELTPGTNALPVVGTMHLVEESERIDLLFSGDGKHLLSLGAASAGSPPSLRAWPTVGGAPKVLITEVGLGRSLSASADGQWVVFLRQSTTVATEIQIGTMAVASLVGEPNVRNLVTNVAGFGFLSTASDLGYISLPIYPGLGSLGHIPNLVSGVANVLIDRVYPDHVAISASGNKAAVLRDTNSNGIEELWVGRFDAGGFILLQERKGIELSGDNHFSKAEDKVVWSWRSELDPESPTTFMLSQIPAVGVPFTTTLGDNVSHWEFTAADGVAFVGSTRAGEYGAGVLRIFDGVQAPGKALQTKVKEKFALLNERVLFVAEPIEGTNDAYILNLGETPPVTACDPVVQSGCSGGEACRLTGPGDIAACLVGGTMQEGWTCSMSEDCAAGTQCTNMVCRRICDAKTPVCPVEAPTCVLEPGNARYGVCVP